ncbi:MAG: group 1 truncated hemoglobin [Planctomycetes bacterium]|nr:group 1 truncated hemoglobin [Planctomycetota bacterium]
MMTSLYEQLGGEPAVSAAVDIFYRKMLGDERVAAFFDDVDMDSQAAKQKGFLTMVLGGPNHYTGQDMRTGHRHLVARGLNDSHVDVVIEHLGATLTELGATAEQVAAVAALANSVRDDVLDRPQGASPARC